MRVELRLEEDEHEYAILIECDQRVTPSVAISTAQQALAKLRTSSEILP
jgi:hypothetical protein